MKNINVSDVKSFEDYSKWKLKLLEDKNLTLEKLFAFGGWCLNRLCLLLQNIEMDLTKKEIDTMNKIIKIITVAAEAQKLIPKDEAENMIAESENLGTKDEVLELDTHTVMMLSCIEELLSFCKYKDINYIYSVSEIIINFADFEISGVPDYSLENMFTFKRLNNELVLQEKVVNLLLSSKNIKEI